MAEFCGKFAAMPRTELKLEVFTLTRFIDLTTGMITNRLLTNLKASPEAFRAAAAAIALKIQAVAHVGKS